MATLGFSTNWPKEMGGEETNFIKKIWKGLIDNELFDLGDLIVQRFMARHPQHKLLPLATEKHINLFAPKLHTIRHDPKGLWVPGMKIHPVVFNRTKNRFQFAPVLECKSVQDFEIVKIPLTKPLGDSLFSVKIGDVWHENYLDNKSVPASNELNQLALNDGFNSVEHFFQWFNSDFTGKIIHWTNLKY